jgi:hypothetical protein
MPNHHFFEKRDTLKIVFTKTKRREELTSLRQRTPKTLIRILLYDRTGGKNPPPKITYNLS